MNYLEYNENDIQSFEYETTIISDGNVIGTCELGKAEIQLLNNSNEYSSFKESWIKTIHGSFYVYDVTPVQEKINIKLSCYDIKYKLDTKYDSSLYEWPMTLVEWRNAIAVNCGIEFNDNNVFPNSDIVLEKEPYVILDASNRTVISMIAQAGCCSVVTDENDFFYFSWFSENEHIVKDWLELTTEKDYTSPVNVVVLGRGDVEDNVFYPNPKPEKPLEFRIDNNYILDPQEAEDKRYDVIEAIYNQVNSFSYLIFNMRAQDIENKLAIKLGEKIKYFDIWDNELNAYVMTKKITYLGGDLSLSDNYEITLSAEKINETSTDFSYATSLNKRILTVERKTDKVEGQILDIVKKTDENSSQIAELEIKSEGIDLAVETAQEAYDKVEVYNPVLESEGNGQLQLPDCAGEESLEFTVKGKSEQETTTQGNNILGLPEGYSWTDGSLTVTVEDGVIVINGSTTNVVTFDIPIIPVKLSGNYVYSISGEGSNKNNISLTLFDSNKSLIGTYIVPPSDGSQRTYALSEVDTTVEYIHFYATANLTYDNVKLYYMVNKGTSVIPFGKFIPNSPSYYYPSEIKNIIGIDNLFNEADYNYVSNALVDSTGLIKAQSVDYRCIYFKVKSDTYYTISANVKKNWVITTTSELPAVGVQGTPRIVTTSKSYTLKTGSDTKYLILRHDNQEVGIRVETQYYLGCELQVVESPIARSYVPFGSNYLVGKVIGKNRFNKSEKPVFQVNTSYEELETGIRVTLNSTTQYRSMAIPILDFEKLLGKTLTLSGNMIANGNNVPSLRIFWIDDGLATVGAQLCMLDESGEVTFTMPTEIPDTATKLVLLLYGNVDGSGQIGDYVDYTEVQLEINPQKTEYEEYKEAISRIDLKGNKLCSNKDLTVRDSLTVKSGMANIDKKIIEVVLDDSFTIYSTSTLNGKRRLHITLTDLAVSVANDVASKVLCDMFSAVSANDTYVEKNGIAVTDNVAIIYSDEINTYSNDEFKTWLSENPITLQYELATPETIDLGEVSIQTVQSDCTLELEEELDTDMYAKYIKNNPYNEAYSTRLDTKAQIQLSENKIESSVSETILQNTELIQGEIDSLNSNLKNNYMTSEEVQNLNNLTNESLAVITNEFKQIQTSTQTQFQAITNILQNGVSLVKTTYITIDGEGLKIAKSTDDFNGVLDNKNLRFYSYETLMSIYSNKGAGFTNLLVTGQADIAYSKIMKVILNGKKYTGFFYSDAMAQTLEDFAEE